MRRFVNWKVICLVALAVFAVMLVSVSGVHAGPAGSLVGASKGNPKLPGIPKLFPTSTPTDTPTDTATDTPTNTPTAIPETKGSVGCIGGAFAPRVSLWDKHPDAKDLEKIFEVAAKDFGVPVEILKAVAYKESGWIHDGPSCDYGYGIMHLVDNNYCQTLQEAAEVSGYSEVELKADPEANVRGAAALIAKYTKETVGKPKRLEDFFDALKRFSGLITEELREIQATEYYEILKKGCNVTNGLGMKIALTGRPIDLSGKLTAEVGMTSTDYGPAIWNPADPSNYSSRTTGIDRWVNHWIGVGTYAGAISWFKNPASNVSAHFVIRSSDGQLTQMVRIYDKAWHCSYWNSRSIGIEHEATSANPGLWNSTPMLTASAACCSYFCDVYGMPKTRTYIVGHKEVPYASTSCPGPMPWDTYMAYVAGGTGGGPTNGSRIEVGHGTNGAQQLFTVGLDGVVYSKWQTEAGGNWSGWWSFGTAGGGFQQDIVVGYGYNGAMQLFTVGNDDAVWTMWQSSPGGTWSGWQSFGGTVDPGIDVVTAYNGCMQLFCESAGALWTKWQTSPGGLWTNWTSLGGGGIEPGVRACLNADDTIEVFVVTYNGILWSKKQSTPGGYFGDFVNLGASVLPGIEIGHGTNGAIQVFARGMYDSNIWTKWQQTPGGNWTPSWMNFGSAGGGMEICPRIGYGSSGAMQLFAIGANTGVYTKWQTEPGGNWTAWYYFDLVGSSRHIDVFSSDLFGTMQLYVIGSSEGVYSRWQLSPGGSWSGWAGF